MPRFVLFTLTLLSCCEETGVASSRCPHSPARHGYGLTSKLCELCSRYPSGFAAMRLEEATRAVDPVAPRLYSRQKKCWISMMYCAVHALHGSPALLSLLLRFVRRRNMAGEPSIHALLYVIIRGL